VLEYRRDARTLMRERTSIRTFRSGPLPADRRRLLEEACSALREGPLGTPCRFLLLDRGAAAGSSPGGERLGTYGVIRGASTYLAGAAVRGSFALLDFGYLFEMLVLKATELGLGTCWLGGTFRRSDFERALQLKDHEMLPAVSPVGPPARRRSLLDRLFRLGAGSRSRRPWDTLFFDDRGMPLSPGQLPRHHREALEMLRLAPSASNRQPWRVLAVGEQVHLYLQRTPGYHRAGGMDLQRLDVGIAMAHFELALRAADPGKAGRGRWEPPGPVEPPDQARRAREDRGGFSFQDLEHMVSWRTDE